MRKTSNPLNSVSHPNYLKNALGAKLFKYLLEELENALLEDKEVDFENFKEKIKKIISKNIGKLNKLVKNANRENVAEGEIAPTQKSREKILMRLQDIYEKLILVKEYEAKMGKEIFVEEKEEKKDLKTSMEVVKQNITGNATTRNLLKKDVSEIAALSKDEQKAYHDFVAMLELIEKIQEIVSTNKNQGSTNGQTGATNA